MDFIHQITREEISFAQLKERYPLTLFPSDFADDFEEYAPVQPVAAPEHDPATQKVVKAAADKQGATWMQAWEVAALTPEEMESARRVLVPPAVTMRQARLALLGAGLLASVDAAIDGLPSPQKEAARIEWEYATEVQRSSGLVPMMGVALGLDDAALDALFIEAAAL